MKTLIVAFFALGLAGCASARGHAPDLAGAWSFQVMTGASAVTHGAMTLVADGPVYRGSLTTDQGANTLIVRTFDVDGRDVRMEVESPDGDVTFVGVLDQSGTAFQGAVTYHNGQRFPMTGARS